jgi:hypothetical protein
VQCDHGIWACRLTATGTVAMYNDTPDKVRAMGLGRLSPEQLVASEA